MIRTYLDAGVLIGGARGLLDVASSDLDLFGDPAREFVASAFLRLEVFPKAIYHRQTGELDYYRQYFSRVIAWADALEDVDALAEEVAAGFGLAAFDALHVAAAMLLDADELVTTEAPRKPIHRVTGVKVVAI